MTAPRARERSDPPMPPDRRPPRRGGGSSPSTYGASAAGRAAGFARPPLVRRGLVRSALALAAAALLLLSGALALPATAEAQTAITLVSNIGQGETSGSSRSARVAQRFTTGPNLAGYNLTGVDIVSTTATSFTVEVCPTDSVTGLPITDWCDDELYGGNPTVGTQHFTNLVSQYFPITLYPDRTYAVVMTPSGDSQGYGYTTVDAVDAGEEDGWSMDAGSFFEDSEGKWDFSDDALRIAIKGTVTPIPAVNVAAAEALEGEDMTFTVTLTELPDPAATFLYVGWATSIESDDTAVRGDVALTRGSVTFPRGSRTGTFTVSTIEDTVAESDETFTVTLRTVGAVTLGANPTAKGTILNDDVADIVAPSPTGITTFADGSLIQVDYDEDLESTGSVDAAFSLSIDGVPWAVVRRWAGGPTIQFFLRGARRYLPGQTLVLSYDASKADMADASGNQVASFTTGSGEVPPITNSSTVIPETTATLGRLEVWDGLHNFSPRVTVEPPFATGTTAYESLVICTSTYVTILAYRSGLYATLEWLDADDNRLEDADPIRSGVQVNLAVGANVIKIKLTAEDGLTTQTYTLTVTRAGSATLRELAVSTPYEHLHEGGRMTPAFAANITSYTASVLNDVDYVRVQPLTGHPDATFEFLDENDMAIPDADSVKYGHQVALSVGANVIKIKVTAQDDMTTETYTLTVTRAPPPTCTLNTGDLWCGVVTVRGFTNDGVSIIAHGFLTTIAGALSNTTLSLTFGTPATTNSYTIRTAVVGAGSTSGLLTFGLDKDLSAAEQAALELRMDDFSAPFSFRAAMLESPGIYRWPSRSSLDWSSESTVTLRLRKRAASAPAFTDVSVTREVAENSAADTEVGTPIPEATDVNNDTLTYTLEGTDANSFTFDAAARQIKTKEGVSYDYETKSSYSVMVKASDATESGTLAVTINLADVAEKSETPAKPTLEAVGGSSTSLAATWEKPDLNGGPDIIGYDVQYRVAPDGTWEDFTHADTTVTATITELTADTEYQVQVRAKNGETASDWSNSSDAVSTNPEMTTPAMPTGFKAVVGNGQVPLSWDTPASGADITRHEYRFKTGTGSYPTAWTRILNSAPGETHQASFTVTGLRNEVVHKFQLQAENDQGVSTVVESDEVTPTPGICDRTEQVRNAIVAATGAAECAAVTVADLAGLSGSDRLSLISTGITSLKSGDFAGLGALTHLSLTGNALSSLPENVFSGLRKLLNLNLTGNALSSLPENVFSEVPRLSSLYLDGNDLSSLPENVFSGLTKLSILSLDGNDLNSLSAGVFSGLGNLRNLRLAGNDLSSLPDNVFSGLTRLQELKLEDNPNSGDMLPLTVTVEKVGTDQARAKVLAGAPFAVNFTPTVVHGTLSGGATALGVARGWVDGTPVTVERTAGTTPAVTVDIDLTTQPSLPAVSHSGYEFVRSTDLPVEILPSAQMDATLSGLSLGMGVTLSPTFASVTATYTASVANSVAEVTVTPTMNHSGATVEYLNASDAALADADTNAAGHQVALAEGDTVIKVKVTSQDGTAMQTYTVTVTRAPTLSIEDAEATEGDGVEFTVTLSAAAAADVTATWTASIETGDTAVAADLGTTKTGTVTVSIGNTTGTFEVSTVEDTTVEANETFTVTLTGPSSDAALGTATATGTIENNDKATVSVADVSAAEGTADDEGLTFTVTLSEAVPQNMSVDWTASIESGDSAAAADLTGDKSGTVTIAKGSTTGMFTVETADTTDEDNQTFTVTLSNPTPTSLAQLAADPTATGTIEDDDPAPTLSVADARHDEDNSERRAEVTVSLSEVSEKRVRFRLRPVDRAGDTASDADWVVLYTSPPFNPINAGTMSSDHFAGVVIQSDTLDEDDETLTVEAFSLENAQGSSSDREATITIVDGDPTPTVTVADAAATEGDKVEFVVTLSAVSGRDVEVGYATSVATGDTAVSGTDFTAATGTLTILAADSTATGTVEVQTTEDDANESAETFTLTLSATKNVELTTDTTATGTINNRATTAAKPTGFEAAVGDAQVTLTWDTPPTGVTRHDYQYKAGTGAYQGWVRIENSGVGGANEAGFTVTTGLTNETEYTFQLRAVNAQGESTAAEAGPVTPTPGICGRTQKVHEAIVYYLEDLYSVERTCAEVNVADLERFDRFLEAGNQGIASLKSGDFAGLTNLETLELDDNSFTTLPADVFSGLTSLETLVLSRGALSSIPDGLFAGLTTLTTLKLESNDLIALPGTVFSGLTALKTLDLQQNDLTMLPANVFSGLSALTSLPLNGNDLTALPDGLFSGLSALKTLQLNHNDLTALDDGVFSGLTALTALVLNDNDLTALDAGAFSGLSNLLSLTLQNN